MPGRRIFTATMRRVPSAATSTALCTCAMEAAAIGGESSVSSDARGAERLTEERRDQRRIERLHLVLQHREILRDLDADDVGPRRERLAEFHIGRAEAVERARQPLDAAGALDVAALEGARTHAARSGGSISARERPSRRGRSRADRRKSADCHRNDRASATLIRATRTKPGAGMRRPENRRARPMR